MQGAMERFASGGSERESTATSVRWQREAGFLKDTNSTSLSHLALLSTPRMTGSRSKAVTHVLSKDGTQKRLSNYHLSVTQTKRQRGRFRGPALLLPGEDAEGTSPQAGDGPQGAPALSAFALAAAMVSVDFGKQRPLRKSVTCI